MLYTFQNTENGNILKKLDSQPFCFVLVLTIFNEGGNLIFKSNFQNALNLF